MKLKKLRESKNLSRRAVVMALEKEGLSITEQTLSNWERDVYEPTVTKAVALAKFYGVALEELVG